MHRSLRASPFMNPFLTPGGWQEEKGFSWLEAFLHPEWIDFENGCLCIQQCLEMWLQCWRSQV